MEKDDVKKTEDENLEKVIKESKQDKEPTEEHAGSERDAEKKDAEKSEEKSEKEDTEKSEEKSEKEDTEKSEEKTEKEPEKKPETESSMTFETSAPDIWEPLVDQTASIKLKKKNHVRRGILGAILILLILVYVGGAVFFSYYYYPDATLNGINVGFTNAEDAKKLLNKSYVNYKLGVQPMDESLTEYINKNDIVMQIQMRDEFKQCLRKQEPWLWVSGIFSKHEYHIGADVKWEEDLLEKIVNNFSFMKKENMTEPTDAYIGMENNHFVIVPEDYGSMVIKENFDQKLREALMILDPILDMDQADCYHKPKILSNDEELVNEAEAKSIYNGINIQFKLYNHEEATGLELYEELLEYKNNSATISKTNVEKYVSELAKQYDTVNTEREFKTSYGKTIKILGVYYGFEMDQEKTVSALYNALTQKKSCTIEAAFTKTGFMLTEENDIGDTYIEVNLSEQELNAYKNGRKIITSPLVSGKVASGDGTVTGLFAIYDKVSPTVLRGDKKKVEKTITIGKGKKKKEKTVVTYEYEYESPVTYWMPFSGGIGLHDANWRSSFGGSIYYYSGSHGCVNLPYKTAKTLYESFGIGTPVVVYYWND